MLRFFAYFMYMCGLAGLGLAMVAFDTNLVTACGGVAALQEHTLQAMEAAFQQAEVSCRTQAEFAPSVGMMISIWLLLAGFLAQGVQAVSDNC